MSFRSWLHIKWQEHVEEVLYWEKCLPSYSVVDYFRKYKWWLKREFRATVRSTPQRTEE
jgi:hypothetical protein